MKGFCSELFEVITVIERCWLIYQGIFGIFNIGGNNSLGAENSGKNLPKSEKFPPIFIIPFHPWYAFGPPTPLFHPRFASAIGHSYSTIQTPPQNKDPCKAARRLNMKSDWLFRAQQSGHFTVRRTTKTHVWKICIWKVVLPASVRFDDDTAKKRHLQRNTELFEYILFATDY